MAWSGAELVKLRINSLNYYFNPATLIFSGEPQTSVNQVTQESESGEIKILTLDTNVRRFAEFSVYKMRYGSPGSYVTSDIGTVTISGWSQLRTLITGSAAMNYRENPCELWFPGTSKAGAADGTFRFWAGDLQVPVVRKPDSTTLNTWLYGDGSQVLTFREDI